MYPDELLLKELCLHVRSGIQWKSPLLIAFGLRSATALAWQHLPVQDRRPDADDQAWQARSMVTLLLDPSWPPLEER